LNVVDGKKSFDGFVWARGNVSIRELTPGSIPRTAVISMRAWYFIVWTGGRVCLRLRSRELLITEFANRRLGRTLRVASLPTSYQQSINEIIMDAYTEIAVLDDHTTAVGRYTQAFSCLPTILRRIILSHCSSEHAISTYWHRP
jgi:hypothetical protein